MSLKIKYTQREAPIPDTIFSEKFKSNILNPITQIIE